MLGDVQPLQRERERERQRNRAVSEPAAAAGLPAGPAWLGAHLQVFRTRCVTQVTARRELYRGKIGVKNLKKKENI